MNNENKMDDRTTEEPSEKEIRDEILRLLMLLSDRSASICPSEVARSLRRHWRQWMPLIREVAAEMAKVNTIEILQKGEVVDIETIQGPIRLRLKSKK